MASSRNTSLPSIVVCGRGSPWPNHLSAAVHPVPYLMLWTDRSSQSNSQPPHVVCVLASSCGALVLDVGFESLTIFVVPRCCCVGPDYHGFSGMIIHLLALEVRSILSNTSFLLKYYCVNFRGSTKISFLNNEVLVAFDVVWRLGCVAFVCAIERLGVMPFEANKRTNVFLNHRKAWNISCVMI